MPIIIPTAAEIDRMDARQRAALVRRLPSTREDVADALHRLDRDITAVIPRRREYMSSRDFDAQAEIAEARRILAGMPRDPDARKHVRALVQALRRTT